MCAKIHVEKEWQNRIKNYSGQEESRATEEGPLTAPEESDRVKPPSTNSGSTFPGFGRDKRDLALVSRLIICN